MSTSLEHLLRQVISTQNEILAQQKESRRLIRILAHHYLRDLIANNLSKPIQRHVFELTDGLRSSRDIEKEIGKEVTQRTVVSWWKHWRSLGILEASPHYSGRMQKVISLEELGIDVDDVEQE
ncbi:hypothetical protein K8I28_14465 [bacterium]|nr:hypothetical protein [bacterium]